MNTSLHQLTSNLLVQGHPREIDVLDLRGSLGFLLENMMQIAATAVFMTLCASTYVLLAKPIYEATMLIQVEDNPTPTEIINRELARTFDLKNAAGTEMEVLRSRKVVSQAVNDNRLYIEARPKYFPLVGAWIARHSEQFSDPALLKYTKYVWGTESAEVSVFNVPPKLEGKDFALAAEGEGNFRLTYKDKSIEIKGKSGETIKAPTAYGTIDLRVERINAEPGANFVLTRRSKLETIEKLQKDLKISEKTKSSGIISVALEGSNPDRISEALVAIGKQYVRQNEERKSEGAAKSLVFLERQLPELKQALEVSEAKYNDARNKRGTVDLSEEAKGLLQQSIAGQTKMVELTQKREELMTRFSKEHPSVQGVDQQAKALNRDLSKINERIEKLPGIEQNVLRLSRDVKVNTDMYTAVLSTAQQLRLSAVSNVGNVRLLDAPEIPIKPIKPNPFIVIPLAAVLGLSLGALGAFTRKSIVGRVDGPEEIEQQLGLPVSAVIAHSEAQKQPFLQFKHGLQQKPCALLPNNVPYDSAIESLRRFRTVLPIFMRASANNIIVVTGSTPGVGKSFISANFAAVLASIGKQVLLIDGDLRTGYLHRYFTVDRDRGLTEGVTGKTSVEQIIHRNVVENVDFISTGKLPSKPTELLAHPNFGKLLQLISHRYDFVLIDTGPVLVVSDALIIAPHAGAIFNVARGGVTTLDEIEESTRQLNQAGVDVTGIVFNDFKPRLGRYGYGAKSSSYG